MRAYGYTQHLIIVIYWQAGWLVDQHEKELRWRGGHFVNSSLCERAVGSWEQSRGNFSPALELSQLLSWLGNFLREQAAKQRSHPRDG